MKLYRLMTKQSVCHLSYDWSRQSVCHLSCDWRMCPFVLNVTTKCIFPPIRISAFFEVVLSPWLLKNGAKTSQTWPPKSPFQLHQLIARIDPALVWIILVIVHRRKLPIHLNNIGQHWPMTLGHSRLLAGAYFWPLSTWLFTMQQYLYVIFKNVHFHL